MTGPHQADGPARDGRDLTLALLAARLSELGGQVGALAARVEAAEIAIGGQAGVVAEAAGLAREVSRLSAAIAGKGAPAAGEVVPVHPRRPVWAAMKDAEHVDALRDVARWVTAILLQRYPGTRAVLAPCWSAHPGVVEELDWLYWDWMGWAVDLPGAAATPPTGTTGGCRA